MNAVPGQSNAEQLEAYRGLQRDMATRVCEMPLAREPRTIAAIDVHLRDQHGIAAAVMVDYPSLEVMEQRIVDGDVTFPYIPGLLSFREAPLCLSAIRSLAQAPDLLLVDGHGRAHPRRFGLACHLGLELEIPTIGVAKSILIGSFGPLGIERESTSPIRSDGEIIGMVVRTRTGVSPLYVSVGNLITLSEAVVWTLNTTTRYRLPEPSRSAHRLAKYHASALS